MSNLNTKFKKILQDLEKNIKDKEDLEYVKVQIFNMYNLFLDEMTKIEEKATIEISELIKKQEQLEMKVKKVENGLNAIEKDIYLDEDSDFSIVCPYCNNEFVVDSDELKEEIKCPECNNIIELDWNSGCDCGYENHDCKCDDKCSHCKEDDDM